MENTSPRLWTYTPSNSPVALPKESLFFNSSELLTLRFPDNTPQEILSGQNLREYCSSFVSEKGTVDELLSLHESPPMSQRRPFLLLGELANPYRLQDIGVGPMPIYTVRITDLCRTYADALDNREVIPGVHHITLARTEGWWEKSHVGMATVEQMKHMVAWLDQGRKGTWKPVRPAEGGLYFETQQINPPSLEEIQWDGHREVVDSSPPEVTGPQIDLKTVMAPVHTNYGCYDNRGRFARCAHISQRDFHDNMFRRGSSKKWNDILDIC